MSHSCCYISLLSNLLHDVTYIYMYDNKFHNGKAKVKHSLHQPITDLKGSRMLRRPDFETIGT